MATTIEYYQKAVNDYEDQVRDYGAELAFANEQVDNANKSLTELRAQRSTVSPGSPEQAELLEKINNTLSRRNDLEVRQQNAFNSLQTAQSSLTQARADLARVSQGEPAPAPPTPAAAAADPETRATETRVISTDNQVVDNFQANPQTDPGEVPGVTVSDRLQTDPGEVPGVTAYGSSYVEDTGGVPTRTLADPTPVAAPAVDPFEVDGADIGATEDEFAGDGYGFVYNEDGELVPADSVATEEAVTEPEPLDDGFSPYGEPDDEPEPVEGNQPEPVNENPWAGRDAEKAAAWEQLTPEDQRWLGDGDPTDEIILSRAPNRGQPRSAVDGVENIEPEAPVDYSVTFEDGFDWVIIDNTTGNFVETGFATQAEADARLAELTGDAVGYQGETTPDDIADVGDDEEAATTQAATDRARAQAAINQQRKQANQGDWRIKLRLAPGSNYLYNDPGISSDGILYPLKVTDGVVFPYVPIINTVYGTNYNSYDLTHSNYRGYFYQNSYIDEVAIQATFTAQDTSEANYLLAVIHFFRSVTKMFYGQDADRGQPPPLVFLQGLGEYQYNLHPCLVRSFTYNLPNDVDYIRARSVQVDGTNLLARRDRQTSPGGPNFLSNTRLAASGLNSGGLQPPPSPPTLGISSPTYVPTKMEISLSLLPTQTREQVSQQFSLKKFASGDLVKSGFW